MHIDLIGSHQFVFTVRGGEVIESECFFLIFIMSLHLSGIIAAAAPWTPLNLSNVAFWMPTSGQHAYQNTANNTNSGKNVVCDPAVNGSVVGQVHTPIYGICATCGQASNDLTSKMPILSSVNDGVMTRSCFNNPFTGSVPSNVVFVGSTKLFRDVHNPTQVMSFHIWINITTAATGTIWSSSDGTAGHAGFRLVMFLTRKLSFIVNDTVGTILTISPNLALTLGKWYRVSVVVNGTGNQACSMTITQAGGTDNVFSATAAASAASSTTNSWEDMSLGSQLNNDSLQATLTAPFKGYYSDPVIQKRAATASDLAAYFNFNPPQNTGISIGAKSLVTQLNPAVNNTLQPGDLSHLAAYVNIRDSSKVFPNTDFTGSISDGAGVGSIRNAVESLQSPALPDGALGFDWVWDAQSGGKATFNSSAGAKAINGKSNMTFNGNAVATPCIYSDLVIDGSDNTKITSAAHPFTSAQVSLVLQITSGTGFTVQNVTINSVDAGTHVATCSAAMGTVGSTGGNAVVRVDNNYKSSVFPGGLGSGDYTFIGCFQNLANQGGDSIGHNGSDLIGGSDADYIRFLGHSDNNAPNTVRTHYNPQINGSEIVPAANQVGNEQLNVIVFRKNAASAAPYYNLVAGAVKALLYTYNYTDLAIDGSDNTKVTSAAFPFFVNQVGLTLNITGGSGFTVQSVTVLSVTANVATCSAALGTTGSTGGVGNTPNSPQWQIFEGGRMGQQANFNGGVNGDPSTTETWAAYGNLVAWAYYNADIGETFALQVARGMMSDVGLL